MLQEPSNSGQRPKKPRRPHPLEIPPATPPPEEKPKQKNSQQAILHIPTSTIFITRLLITVNSIIFVLGFLSPQFGADMLQFGWNLPVAVLQDGEYHRLFTAMFLHANPAHIFFNMYMLYVLGNTVERLFGSTRFAIIYFGGGLLGSVISTVLGNPDVPSIGASGAVFALLGAEVVFLYKNRKLMGQQAMARVRYLVILAGINLVLGFASPQIDNFGHIGGLLGGLGLTWFIGPNYLLRLHPDYPEESNHFVAEDMNPLEQQYSILSAYAAVVIGILLVGVLLSR